MLAGMLREVPNLDARQEYIHDGDRHFHALSWYLGDVYTRPYLERARRRIEAEHHDECFADVNAGLQCSVDALKAVFEPDEVFHLVRDPREVVRSIYVRRPAHRTPLIPPRADAIERCLDGDKFTYMCMQWAEVTRTLVQQGTRLIRLEQIVRDYEYVRRELLQPLGLSLPRQAWEKQVSIKVNRTHSPAYRYLYSKLRGKAYVSDRLPPFAEWPPEYKREFHEICGEAMQMVGYGDDG